MQRQLKKLRELPCLPGRRTAPFRDVEVCGVEVRVYKAKSHRTVPVSARLLSLLGEELYRLFAHSESDDESAGPLRGLLEVDFDDDEQAKTAFAGIILPLLYDKVGELSEDDGPGSLFWYFSQILGGNVELEGVKAKSMDDLDAMGFGVSDITRLFWAGVELAFFPTRGAPDTTHGSRAAGTPEESQAQEILSTPVASGRVTGRSARISTTAG